MNVIEVEGLHKEYRKLRGGRTVAVDDLSLAVPAGGVYGFLGPNGSGKTTTIRCLLGLVRPSSGNCSLLGADVAHDLHTVITRVGSIVESPALFPTFSGRRNLDLLAATYGLRKTAVDEVLEVVGLADRAKDQVKNYSLGMRQRLAIGAALLKDPELLILDEPANGLDPAGIKEVRTLLRRIGDEGRTVFVSSHQLSEVRQVCDHVAILARGRCVASGSVDEVLRRDRAASMLLKTNDLGAAVAALTDTGMQAVVERDLVRVTIDPQDGALVSEALARRGLYPSELRADEVDLETVFLELTEEVAA